MYFDLYTRRGYHQEVKAIQVCIRKRDCHVCGLLFTERAVVSFHERYAYFKKLDYFSTECIYSPDAYRGHARTFLKDLEVARPSAIIDIIHSGEAFEVREDVKATQKPQSKAGATRSDLEQLTIFRNMQTLRLYVQQRGM